jgi:hypothetical protein
MNESSRVRLMACRGNYAGRLVVSPVLDEKKALPRSLAYQAGVQLHSRTPAYLRAIRNR